jgi:hypothetical protein
VEPGIIKTSLAATGVIALEGVRAVLEAAVYQIFSLNLWEAIMY